MNIANILTLIRVMLVPMVVVAFYLPWGFAHYIAAAIFILAAITDMFDGYLARNLHQVTHFGTFLDPVADKLVVAVSLVLVVAKLGHWYVAIPAAVIIGREIAVSGLREWMAEVGKRNKVAVTHIAKIKTVIQMVAISLLLIYRPGDGADNNQHYLLIFSLVLLYLATVMTLWSMTVYLKAAWVYLFTNAEAASDGVRIAKADRIGDIDNNIR